MVINQNILEILRTFVNLQINYKKIYTNRSSNLRCIIKKGVLKNFVNFTGNYQYQSFFLNRVAGLSPLYTAPPNDCF